MMLRNYITAIITCLLLLQPAVGITGDNSLRVAVNVSAKDSIKNLITSYVTRELRSISDVVIVENNPQWELSIVALEVKTKGGEKTGVAFSTVVLEPFDNQILTTALQKKYKDIGTSLTSNLYEFQAQWLQVGSDSDIRTICSGIVADFDGEYLEKRRRFYQQIKELYKKKK